MKAGDVTSVRTVMSPAPKEKYTVVDSVTGLQTDDVVVATGIPANTTISSINTGTKPTISNNTSAGITTSTQLITHAKDTNTDRGISFNYNTSRTANNKLGFFEWMIVRLVLMVVEYGHMS